MLNFFDYIVNFFNLIFSMIQGFIQNTLSVILITQNSLIAVSELFSIFNGFIGVSIGLVLCVGVIKLLLGWGNV